MAKNITLTDDQMKLLSGILTYHFQINLPFYTELEEGEEGYVEEVRGNAKKVEEIFALLGIPAPHNEWEENEDWVGATSNVKFL